MSETLTLPGGRPDHDRTSLHSAPAVDGATLTVGVELGEPSAIGGGIPPIPGFEILREAGRGGMGVVYQARELALNRMVALKMVDIERAASAEELIRFRFEAEAAARVRHPNVVQIYESGAFRARPYLVMEWIEGGTLADALKLARLLPPRLAARLTAVLARALHQIHASGVVHRDLKPGNVMLARSEPRSSSHETRGAGLEWKLHGTMQTVVPKITDFGLAKLTVNAMGLTETGRVMGTPEFMSPEQAAGRNSDIGPASDIHALGVMLYQMVVGHTPFRGDSTYAVVRRVIEDEPESLRAVVTERIPRDLETICMKCLRKDPQDRYVSAGALADDLDALLEGRPISARPVGRPERAWKFTRRNPVLTGLAAAVVVSLVGGLAATTWQWRHTRAERNRALAAEAEARRQHRASEAVNRFLVADMIAAAAPDRAQGRPVTVMEALDAAALRVAVAFPDDPSAAAAVRHALGESYRKLGRPAAAIPVLKEALDTRTAQLGADHADTLATACEWALALDDAGRWEECEALLRTSAARAAAVLDSDHAVTLRLQAALGLALHVHGHRDEGLALLTAVLEARERTLGGDHAETLRVANDLGLMEYERHHVPAAAAWAARAAAGRERILGPHHPDTLESLNNLAAVREAENQPGSAAAILESVVERSQSIRGATHADTLIAINNLGRMHYRQKHFPEALASYRTAAEAASATLGPSHPLTLKFQHNLGTVHAAMKDYPAAMATLSAVDTARRLALPDGHADRIQSAHDLGMVYLFSGGPDRAAGLLEEAFRGRTRLDGVTHRDTILTASAWGRAVLESGLGNPLLERAIQALAGVVTAAKAERVEVATLEAALRPLTARARTLTAHEAQFATRSTFIEKYALAMQTAQSLVKSGDMAGAARVAMTAVELAQPHDPPEPQLGQARLLAGQSFLAAGLNEHAWPPLREAYEVLQRGEPGSYDSGIAANLLGRCQTRRRAFAEAETLLLSSYETIRTQSKPGLSDAARRARLAKVRVDIQALYEASGDAVKIKKWANTP